MEATKKRGALQALALLAVFFAVFAVFSHTVSAQADCNVNQTFSYTYYNPNSVQDNVRLTLINSSDPTVNFQFTPGVFFFVYGNTNKTMSVIASANHTTTGTAYIRVSKNGNPIAVLEAPFSLSCETEQQQPINGGNGSTIRILEIIGAIVLGLIIIAAIIFAVIGNSGGKKPRDRKKAKAPVSEKTVAVKAAPKKEKNSKVDVDKILKKYELEEGKQQWGIYQWIMLVLFIIFLIAIIIIAITNMHFSLADITARGLANTTNATH